MTHSIFTRPLFINPQGYLTIPELSLLHKSAPFKFNSSGYTFGVTTAGLIKGKILKAGNEFILHLDMHNENDSCVLGEFYISGELVNVNNFNITQTNGFVTIDFGIITDVSMKLDIGKLNIDKLK